MMETLQQFYPVIIVGSAVIVIFCFGELAVHKFSVRRVALRDGDKETAATIANEGLMAFGIACSGAWLMLAITAGNAAGSIVQFMTVFLLGLGAVAAVWLYIRIRFR